jgi:hypothetical protein
VPSALSLDADAKAPGVTDQGAVEEKDRFDPPEAVAAEESHGTAQTLVEQGIAGGDFSPPRQGERLGDPPWGVSSVAPGHCFSDTLTNWHDASHFLPFLIRRPTDARGCMASLTWMTDCILSAFMIK